ncbi:hypothetical protein RQM59_09500 [Flavobacteriaceae bacterium S356]|uniref:VOC domain-containing protein n=1 Tax=Asprobacillus argus TaxID=3076534 RepID=A0ABU3LFW7_9FLAO|nr:hypothetical protein [Flavobacteriaceae bacterium S356]
MIQNKFIWADLSSYKPKKIRSFYETVFDWSYYDAEGYLTAYVGNIATSGLYETPEKFKRIKMPSFWMSYIQVESVEEIVKKAKHLGGIVELVDMNNPIRAVALIRDTQGAGFTVYEGTYLDARTTSVENSLIFNELHVSNVQKAVEFYEDLFNWRCMWTNETQVEVFCKSSMEKLATISQVDNFFKGKHQYWVCTFGVRNIRETTVKIKQCGGYVIFDEGNKVMCSDGSEAFFYVQEI